MEGARLPVRSVLMVAGWAPCDGAHLPMRTDPG
jgi:hypothetical protein